MDLEKLYLQVDLKISGIHLLAVHGSCCLALRHPGNTGPSRELVLEFKEAAEGKLIEIGALTKEDLEEIHHVEARERKKGKVKWLKKR